MRKFASIALLALACIKNDAVAGSFECSNFTEDQLSKNTATLNQDYMYINGSLDTASLFTTAYFQNQAKIKIDPLRGHSPPEVYKAISSYCILHPDDGVVVAVMETVRKYATKDMALRAKK